MFGSPFGRINPSNPMNIASMGQMRSMYQALMNAKDPVAVFCQLAGNNPQLQPIAKMLSQGNNPQALFNSLCEQRGINPDEFIKALKG